MKTIAPAAFLSALVLMAACHSQAAIVNLSFSGTYDTGPSPVFGLSGTAVPFTYWITYDTALDTDSKYFAAGALLGGTVTTHDWYAYSASGITASSLTFGGHTWTAGNLVARIPAVGVSGDFWFDTDISIAIPTRSWLYFDGGNSNPGWLGLGDGMSDEVNIFMRPISNVFSNSGPIRGSGFSTRMDISNVPEPGAFALLGPGTGCAGFGRRKEALRLKERIECIALPNTGAGSTWRSRSVAGTAAGKPKSG